MFVCEDQMLDEISIIQFADTCIEETESVHVCK